jgi:hypothetical protein
MVQGRGTRKPPSPIEVRRRGLEAEGELFFPTARLLDS